MCVSPPRSSPSAAPGSSTCAGRQRWRWASPAPWCPTTSHASAPCLSTRGRASAPRRQRRVSSRHFELRPKTKSSDGHEGVNDIGSQRWLVDVLTFSLPLYFPLYLPLCLPLSLSPSLPPSFPPSLPPSRRCLPLRPGQRGLSGTQVAVGSQVQEASECGA